MDRSTRWYDNDADLLDFELLLIISMCEQTKNSWSRHWGEDGYIKISQKADLCGVAAAATYPVLAD